MLASALAILAAAYQAEAFRGAYKAISAGQIEAAAAFGIAAEDLAIASMAYDNVTTRSEVRAKSKM